MKFKVLVMVAVAAFAAVELGVASQADAQAFSRLRGRRACATRTCSTVSTCNTVATCPTPCPTPCATTCATPVSCMTSVVAAPAPSTCCCTARPAIVRSGCSSCGVTPVCYTTPIRRSCNSCNSCGGCGAMACSGQVATGCAGGGCGGVVVSGSTSMGCPGGGCAGAVISGETVIESGSTIEAPADSVPSEAPAATHDEAGTVGKEA